MLSFTVTAYQEMSDARENGKRILRCIEPAIHHPAVAEIVIVDDGSDDSDDLRELVEGLPKVRFFRLPSNVGVFTNKVEVVARSTQDWAIICDSDNLMGADYLDASAKAAKNESTWYCPSFAKPKFDYRELIGVYDKKAIAEFLHRPLSHCAVNTGNQVVYTKRFNDVFARFRGVKRFDLLLPNYLNVCDRENEKWHLAYGATDSFLLVKLWLDSGGSVKIVDGLQYEHRVHEDRSLSNYHRAPREKMSISKALCIELGADVWSKQ